MAPARNARADPRQPNFIPRARTHHTPHGYNAGQRVATPIPLVSVSAVVVAASPQRRAHPDMT